MFKINIAEYVLFENNRDGVIKVAVECSRLDPLRGKRLMNYYPLGFSRRNQLSGISGRLRSLLAKLYIGEFYKKVFEICRKGLHYGTDCAIIKILKGMSPSN